jgi:hypothetical protein
VRALPRDRLEATRPKRRAEVSDDARRRCGRANTANRAPSADSVGCQACRCVEGRVLSSKCCARCVGVPRKTSSFVVPFAMPSATCRISSRAPITYGSNAADLSSTRKPCSTPVYASKMPSLTREHVARGAQRWSVPSVRGDE